MVKLNSLLLFSPDPEKLSVFYEKVFGKKPDWVDNNYHGFESDGFYLTIGPHDKVKGANPQPERMMINFETHDVKSEFNRIVEEAHPKVIAEPYAMDGSDEAQIATFEDPDGNYFQLMIPFDVDLSKN